MFDAAFSFVYHFPFFLSCVACRGPDFCIQCLTRWSGSSSTCQVCSKNTTREILGTCETKVIDGVRVPIYRSCPSCKTLINHKEACNKTFYFGYNQLICLAFRQAYEMHWVQNSILLHLFGIIQTKFWWLALW